VPEKNTERELSGEKGPSPIPLGPIYLPESWLGGYHNTACAMDRVGEKAAGANMQPVGSQAQGGGAPRQTSNRRTQGKSGNYGLAIPEFYPRRCRLPLPGWGVFVLDLLRKLIW